MSHVLSSETGMIVSGLMCSEEHAVGLYVFVLRKGLPNSEDTSKPLLKVYEDVPRMLERLVNRKNTLPLLADKAQSILAP